MQDYLSSDLQTTANFAFQKPASFGILQRGMNSHVGVHKALKNSQFFDEIFKHHQQNVHHDTYQTQSSEIQHQKALNRIKDFQNINLDVQKGKKNTNILGNNHTKVAPSPIQDQSNNIIPSTLAESLQILSKLEYRESYLLKDSIRDMNFRQIQKNSHNDSNVNIDINFGDYIGSSELFPKKQRSLLRNHFISQQIAITYVPLRYGSAKMKKAHLYSKFIPNFKQIDDSFSSSKSLSSNLPFGQNLQLKDCMVNSTANFVKLHEVDLFMKRKEIRIERSDELLLANERLLTNHLVVKQELQRFKKSMQKLELQYKNKIEQVQHELKEEIQSKKPILAEKQQKQSILKNIKTLNEQYLKQNNDLKEKIKVYVKNIHELKYELANKRNVDVLQDKVNQYHTKQHNHSNKSLYVPLPTINSLPSNHEATDRTQVHIPTKKQVTLPAYEAKSIGHLQERQKTILKMNNVASQSIIRNIKQRKLSSNDMVVDKFITNIGNNTKSQKSIGIKRNNTTHYEIAVNQNFVNVDKNIPSQNSMILKLGENHHDHSVSNFSNMSGMSKSHKIGHVTRPIYESKKGIILDYMAQNETEQQRQDTAKQQRFKYKRQNM